MEDDRKLSVPDNSEPFRKEGTG